jgi:Flp pilus assembly protein TadD
MRMPGRSRRWLMNASPSKKLWLFACLLVLAACCGPTIAATLGSVSGVVHDAEGRPLAAVQLTLKDAHSESAGLQTLTNNSGEYRFTDVAFGNYFLSANLPGYTASYPISISLTADNAIVRRDLILKETDASVDGASSQAPPKFEAAGLHGLIDPGGYSAPAQAAAASGLVKGMANLEGSEGDLETSGKNVPCTLEPELKQAVEKNLADPKANYELGEFYLAHNQPARAATYLETAHRASPADETVSRQLAIARIHAKQFDAARQLLSGLHPGDHDAETHALLAQANEGSGLFSEAAREYAIASSEKPREAYFFGEGYEYILAGKLSQADEAFQRGLTKYPSSLNLLLGAGAAKFLEGDSAAAVDFFLHAAQLYPTDKRPYRFLVGISATHPEKSAAIRRAFDNFVKSAPEDPDAAYSYAVVLWNTRGNEAPPMDFAQIEALLKRSIALRPHFPKAHFQLGILDLENSNFQSAVTELELALSQDPGLNEARYSLSLAYKRLGQSERAAEEMQRLEQSRSSIGPQAGAPDLSQFISVLAPDAGAGHPAATCPTSTSE